MNRVGRADHNISPFNFLRKNPPVIRCGWEFRKSRMSIVKFFTSDVSPDIIGHGIAVKSITPIGEARTFITASARTQNHRLAFDNNSLARLRRIIKCKPKHAANSAVFILQKACNHCALNKRYASICHGLAEDTRSFKRARVMCPHFSENIKNI